ALIGACEAPVRDAPVDLGAVAEGIVGAVEHLRDRHHFEQHRDLPRREAELEAIFGWHGGAMAAHYTREANRARLAREAMRKLANDDGTSIPAPDDPVRAEGRKTT